MAVLLVLLGLAAAVALDLSPAGLAPKEGGLRLLGEFMSHALSPALDYESTPPDGAPPIIAKALEAARRTVVFAAAGMSLALVVGLVLGYFASSAWWSEDLVGGRTGATRGLRRLVGPALWTTARALVVALRSVHELLWAVLFLAALGLDSATAVLAIALPYGGTLAKVFGELVDEAPRDATHALRQLGARGAQTFLLGLVPRALPDMCAYAFYRFECAIRSSAVLGFFGFETLGYSIKQSFENLHYGEVWLYLWTLFALVAAVELWSAKVRRRFVA
jgi:phosphonate transport system permease protein